MFSEFLKKRKEAAGQGIKPVRLLEFLDGPDQSDQTEQSNRGYGGGGQST